jgi:TolA-binding protein
MKKLIVAFALLALGACNTGAEKTTETKKDTAVASEPITQKTVPPRKQMLEEIGALEKELYASKELDPEKAKKMISLYETFSQQYYNYPEVADFLFKAGELAENINQDYRAITFYTKCYEEHPDYKYSAEALFRMANLYDYKIRNYIKAKALYEEVQTQYPKSPWAKDAAAAIKLMGKSDQDMIREFEKKNGVKK